MKDLAAAARVEKATLGEWQWPLALAALATGVVLLGFRLQDIAGLHRDEAAFGVIAEAIMGGLRPVQGAFNNYTSPLHYYLLAGAFSLFGPSIAAMRAVTVLFNVLAAGLMFDALRRLSPRVAVAALWLLVTMPAFVVFGRIAGENYALNPFFLSVAAWCYLVVAAPPASSARRAFGLFAAGAAMGLGIWNHLVFAAAAVPLGICALVFDRRLPWRLVPRQAAWLALGGAFGFAPKLILAWIYHQPVLPQVPDLYYVPSTATVAFLNALATLGGDALYARAVGRVVWSTYALMPLAVAAAIILLLYPRRMVLPRRTAVGLLTALLLMLVITWRITPSLFLGSRVWLLPIWLLPPLVASAFASLPNRWFVSLCATICVINLGSISINFFREYALTGGRSLDAVDVGGRTDNSWDFTDPRDVIAKVCAEHVGRVMIDPVNFYKFFFLFPAEQRARLVNIEMLRVAHDRLRTGDLLIAYAGRQYPPALLNGVTVELEPRLSSSTYNVFRVVAPPLAGVGH